MAETAAGASNCSHITSTLTTTDSEEGDFVKKYKSVVSWYSHRSNQIHCQPSKRRKVSKMISSLSFYVEFRTFPRIDCCTNMWNLWYCTVSAFCVLSMLVCRMLVGWTCCHAPKRIGSLVLQVTLHFFFCWTRHLLRWTGVDVKSGSVYCSECNNFIYHSKLDALYLATIVAAEEKQMGVCLFVVLPHRSDTPFSYS